MEKHTDTLEMLREQLAEFAADRDWDQFHNPKNLAMALAGEAGEVLEHFQWLTLEQSSDLPTQTRAEVALECADVLLFLLRLCDKLDIDLAAAAKKKLVLNAKKYPVEKSRGKATAITQYLTPRPGRSYPVRRQAGFSIPRVLALVLIFVIGMGYRIESFGREIVASTKCSPALPSEFVFVDQKANDEKGRGTIFAAIDSGEVGKLLLAFKTGQHFSRIYMHYWAGFAAFQCDAMRGARCIWWDCR